MGKGQRFIRTDDHERAINGLPGYSLRNIILFSLWTLLVSYPYCQTHFNVILSLQIII